MINQNNLKKKPNPWKITTFIFMALFLSSLIIIIFFLPPGKKISKRNIKTTGKIYGLEFTSDESELMIDGVQRLSLKYKELREQSIENIVPPALYFFASPLNIIETEFNRTTVTLPELPDIKTPGNIEDLAFAPLTTLSRLLKTRQISSTALTSMYLQRLKKYGPVLECVISLTEELALKQSRKADEEIASGLFRGPLHGIPYGAKDLLATRGITTTWGAKPYKDQGFDIDATVIKRLKEAGAVLVAKLTTGALAMGHYWYGGKTRNPWDLEQGSSGSSAGPASATAAGLVGFSIGSETRGSIISPSTRCGVTGLRPTFGRVSRYGSMALSWSMDKLGPICRTAEDCAMVFSAIHGRDGKDPTVVDRPFAWPPPVDIKTLRIGYLKNEFDKEYNNKKRDAAVLNIFRDMGVTLIPLELPDFPVNALSFILSAEAAAAFDELTRSGEDDLLVRQTKYAWPNVFRIARLIPAVEYIRANRLRTILMRKMHTKLTGIDVYIAPSFGNPNLSLTNLTGHPAVVVPNGFDEKGHPTSITFTGNLFKEAKTLAAAAAFQAATDYHLKHPPLNMPDIPENR